jgi:phosphoheptose isomerase
MAGNTGFRVWLPAMTDAANRLDATADEVAEIRRQVGTAGAAGESPLAFGKLPNSAKVDVALNVCVEQVSTTLSRTGTDIGGVAGFVRAARQGYQKVDAEAAARYNALRARLRRR